MNQQHINSLLNNIEHYIEHDTFLFSRSIQNQLTTKVNQLRDEINKAYDKAKGISQ